MGKELAVNGPLESNSKDLLLSKLLLVKYGAITSFMQDQLSFYPIACCPMAIDGYAEIVPDEREVIFYIFTEKNYVRDYGGIRPEEIKERLKARSKLSPKYWLMTESKYNKQKNIAQKNLLAWSRQLMWDNTKVKVLFDVKPE
jgi:hypothetical protein